MYIRTVLKELVESIYSSETAHMLGGMADPWLGGQRGGPSDFTSASHLFMVIRDTDNKK